MSDKERIRWAPKVSQAKIRQLYQTDARGIVDEELIDEVGIALFSRCHSVLLVSNAQAECPLCGRVFEVGFGRPEDEPVLCPADGCGWQTTGPQWHNSWRHQDLIGTRAITAFETYVERYPKAKGHREKMFLIDRLIHAFHQGIRPGMPHRSAANNLIVGNHRQVMAFLDELTYGEASTGGLKQRRAEWQEKMKQVEQVRRCRKR